ncbi:cytochrome c biogenesis protein CcdC [Fodinisporobacter ferrooxydans]|uniref:Cytochrome c biogenesis protein CcdC n=1 Tax=Fodinisporobacter ferrooxydans TaxID=2901836 RepID=A0ABY4CN79_9BACL|nr:cytochrome c biogenesis protein CcdC [Alicyclobacillaceae bacterium MYW30-H2]
MSVNAGIPNIQFISTIVAVCMALLVIVVRMKASKKPTSLTKILMPPIGMSTGFFMFLAPETRLPWLYVFIAVVVGGIFSLPLIATSKFEYLNGNIYLKRSKGFPLILLFLLALRIGLHNYVEQYISLPQTGGAFFILAFAMIVPWRYVMYVRYRALLQQVPKTML